MTEKIFDLGNTSNIATSIGFPIREIAHSQTFSSSTTFNVPDDIEGSELYISGCGGGGGGSGHYYAMASCGGIGGQGGASGFRIPLSVRAGDSLSIIVGAGGAGSHTHATLTDRAHHFGGDGGDTIVRNDTAIADNRFGKQTPFLSEINLMGGGGGRHRFIPSALYKGDNLSVPNEFYEGRAEKQPIKHHCSVYAKFTDAGFWVAGGECGGPHIMYVYKVNNNKPSEWRAIMSTPSPDVMGQRKPKSTSGGNSLYAASDLGVGGAGSASSNVNGADGSNGILIMEWD